MHIAFNGWFWDQPNTGSGQYLRRLVGALHRMEPSIRLTVILPPGAPADDVPPGVEVALTRGSRSNLGKVWFEQRTFPAAAARAGAELAHVPYWGAPLQSPLPLIVSILDVIPLAIPDYAEGLAARLYTSLQTAAARDTAGVITISEWSKTEIVKYLHLPAESITVTPLAADEAYHPRIGAERDAEVRAKYDLPHDYVLYWGGFDVRKQVSQLMLAYSYVGPSEGESYPLVVAGREPAYDDRLFPNVRAYADRLGITPYLHWIGYVDEVDKPAIMRMARLFVWPSVYEGFGLPVLEAMASGVPVVANDIPVNAEVGGEAAFLTKPGEARPMAGAMLALLMQEPLREEQIQRGLGQATRSNWRKTARLTLDVYERALQIAKSKDKS